MNNVWIVNKQPYNGRDVVLCSLRLEKILARKGEMGKMFLTNDALNVASGAIKSRKVLGF
jgi:hypothetical protein